MQLSDNVAAGGVKWQGLRDVGPARVHASLSVKIAGKMNACLLRASFDFSTCCRAIEMWRQPVAYPTLTIRDVIKFFAPLTEHAYDSRPKS